MPEFNSKSLYVLSTVGDGQSYVNEVFTAIYIYIYIIVKWRTSQFSREYRNKFTP